MTSIAASQRINPTIELTANLKKVAILIVDNNEMTVDLMPRVLKYLGFRDVYGAKDGFDALRIMRQHDIDLVITDWELHSPTDDCAPKVPDGFAVQLQPESTPFPHDGASFIKYLRTSKYSPNRYIDTIMLTGFGLQNDVEYARDAGVNEVVLKPVAIDTLCERIIALVEDARPFVTSETYRGPCRRRGDCSHDGMERRKMDIKIYNYH